MIQEGDILYFSEENQIMEGKVINLTETTFELEGVGCCCEGNCVISRSMVGYTYFKTKEECHKKMGVK